MTKEEKICRNIWLIMLAVVVLFYRFFLKLSYMYLGDEFAIYGGLFFGLVAAVMIFFTIKSDNRFWWSFFSFIFISFFVTGFFELLEWVLPF